MNGPVYETLGKYCGRMETPKVITFDHDKIQLSYRTNATNLGAGFRLEWVLEGAKVLK